MKNKLLKLSSLAALLVFALLCFASCDVPGFVVPGISTGNGEEGNNGGDGGEHTHKYSKSVIKPDCVKNGYTTNTCECGDSFLSDYVEALGHNYSDVKYEVAEGKSICLDGGIGVMSCSVCSTVARVELGPQGHSVSGWSVFKSASTDVTGEVRGVCDACSANVSVELPRLSSEKYAYTEKLTSIYCANKEGVGTYTVYIDKSGNLRKENADGCKAISFSVAVKGSYPHVLNKIEMKNDSYPSSTKGIVELSGFEASCQKTGNGYFVCDLCQESVFITTTKGHTFEGAATVLVSPTCSESGSSKSYCSDCKSSITYAVDPLGHKYAFALVSDDNGILTLDVSCSACALNQRRSLAVYETKRVDATCRKEGSITYSFKMDNTAVSFVHKLAIAGHTLGGVVMSLDEVYPPDTKGIIEFVNSVSTCTVEGSGYYLCDSCGEGQMVRTRKAHSGEVVSEVPPTCAAYGSKTINCTLCSSVVTEQIPPLGHDYECSLLNASDSAVSFIASCRVCHISEEITSSVFSSALKAPTCSEYGKIIYTVTHNGNTYTVEEKTAEMAHHVLNGAAVDLNVPQVLREGMIEFSNCPATKTENGKGYFICDICGEMQMIITKYDEN